MNVLAPEVGKAYMDLINYALATASLQLAQATVNLALQIFDACNPFKTLFGGGAAVDNRELKICNAAARRRAFKTKNIVIEDNTYE